METIVVVKLLMYNVNNGNQRTYFIRHMTWVRAQWITTSSELFNQLQYTFIVVGWSD